MSDVSELVEVHRGPAATPWLLETSCRVCLDFNDRLEGSAMSGELWVQRGKILIAFARAHHSHAFSDTREWLFIRELQAPAFGWPDHLLREIAELVFDAGLEEGNDGKQPVFLEGFILKETTW